MWDPRPRRASPTAEGGCPTSCMLCSLRTGLVRQEKISGEMLILIEHTEARQRIHSKVAAAPAAGGHQNYRDRHNARGRAAQARQAEGSQGGAQSHYSCVVCRFFAVMPLLPRYRPRCFCSVVHNNKKERTGRSVKVEAGRAIVPNEPNLGRAPECRRRGPWSGGSARGQSRQTNPIPGRGRMKLNAVVANGYVSLG